MKETPEPYEYNFEEFKRREFLGDALLRFISIRLICTDWKIRCYQRNVANNIGANRVLALIAKELGLQPHPDATAKDPNGNYYPMTEKVYADALEVKLYNVFLERGIDGVELWFKETIMPIYFNLDDYTKRQAKELEAAATSKNSS